MTYTSLEQRMLSAYLAMLPDFIPKKNAPVSIEEQRTFYKLIKDLYQLLFEDPARIVPTLHEDDAFPSRYKKGYGKPELEANVLKIKRAVEGFLKNMFLLGQRADVKLTKRQINLLSAVGIINMNELPAAWI